jgi:hypothetical protein
MNVRRLAALALLSLTPFKPALGSARQEEKVSISAPVLKWQRGGCTGGGCQTGWYASPAVADLDRNGTTEVVWGSYDVVVLNGADGSVRNRATSGNRVWPGVVVADLTGDGTLEIVVGRNSNQVTVYNSTLGVVWTRNPFSGGEVRTLAVADLDNDGRLEIVVGRASGGSTQQVNVYDAAGNVRPGWPARHNGDPGFGSGMYNENVTVADLNNDGFKEVIAPTDTHYITALDRNGNQLPASGIYGANKVWSQVGVHVDHAVDLRGFANCGTEHRPNFANCAPAIADVNLDGTFEIVATGDVYDCAVGDNEQGDLYVAPWILKLDRTRWAASGFDWTAIPTPPPNAGPLSEDFDIIENNVHNAVVADLDGDGLKEVLFPSYDGRLNCYWLDKTQHGSWPHAVPGSGMRFAGEPAVVDVDNDGHAEVIFTSWPEKSGTAVGQLHVLDYLGNQLFAVNLPASFPAGEWNGGLAAPTIANIDADADVEIVVGTSSSGVVAYDLPNSAGARVLWGTGRGSYRRAGVAAVGTETAAVYDRPGGAWFVRNANGSGPAHLTFGYGPGGMTWTPLSGDYTGNGYQSPGLYDPSAGAFYLRASNSPGAATFTFIYGPAGAGFVPLVGDWNGDGVDTVGVYNPATGAFFLRNSNAPGPADVTFIYGPAGAGWLPVAGDWNGDGRDTIGLYDPANAAFFLKNANAPGPADVTLAYGPPNATPIMGDWNGDGRDTVGIYVSASGAWFVKNTNAPGPADATFVYGPPNKVPVVGNWDGQ